MAKKKRGLAAYKKKRTQRNTQVIKAKENPPPMQDLVEFIVPGFAGYAGTRLASRIVHGMVIKRFPKLAKHASVLSTFGAAGAAWLAVHRIKRIEQYHTPVVVGASIAAIQTAVQAYLPKYGWMVSDHDLQAQSQTQAPKSYSASTQQLPASPSVTTKSGALPPPIAQLSTTEIVDELDDMDMGVLTSNIGSELSDAEMDMMIDEAYN
jgi:hypothetical protein